MNEPHDDSPASQTQGAPRRRQRAWRLALGLGLPLLLAGGLGAALGGAYWASGRADGTAWMLRLLGKLPLGVQVADPQGPLRGDFSARQVAVRIGSTQVIIDAPRWTGMELRLARHPGTWAVLGARTLEAQRVSVEVKPSPPSGKPARLPQGIRLPLEIDVQRVTLGELRVPGLQQLPFRELEARVHLGADQGRQHRFEALRSRFASLALSGHARIDAAAPMALDVQLQAAQTEMPKAGVDRAAAPAWAQALRQDWQARLAARGPLAGFDLQASVQAKGQTLDASARVEPVSAWPLPRLEATTQALDLSALLPQIPATALSGSIRLQSSDPKQARVTLVAALDNARPGTWADHLLPLRRLSMTLQAHLDAKRSFDLSGFEAVLADARREAGSLRGRGRWDGQRFEVHADLQQLQPAAADARLPAMTLSGPIEVAGRLAPQASPGTLPGLFTELRARADLSGRLAGGGENVAIKLDATGDASRLELHQFEARAGSAQARVTGRAEQGAGQWKLQAQAGLRDFDPRLWWPWPGNPAWAAGPQRLNLQGDLALTLRDKRPDPAASQLPWLDLLSRLQGKAELQLKPSVLAGEALSGHIELQRASAAEALKTSARADIAGNQLRLDGQLHPQDSHLDRWTLNAEAPALARLAPVLRMLPGASASGLLEGLQGNLSAQAQLTGRWPALSSEGRGELNSVRAGPLTLGKGKLSWQLGTGADSPLNIQADLDRGTWGAQQFVGNQVQVKGTVRSHTLNVRSEMNASPPTWLENLQGRAGAALARARTQASLRAQGGFSGGFLQPAAHRGGTTAAEPIGWKGTLDQLEIRRAGSEAPPWIATRNVGLELLGGPLPRFAMSAGRADIFSAGLRWDSIAWQSGDGLRTQALNMQAELEPLAIAPLLSRLQPDFGWSGDLKVGAKLLIRQAENFDADIVLERSSGDLQVTDDSGTQALGLTDLVLSLTAHDGVWSFTQGLAGKQLGVAAGSFVARTSPQLAWPDPQAALQGIFEAKVEHLGAWGAWVPAGWRLGGQLRATASLAGRVGAPEYTGAIEGNGITVRNLLQGVSVSDGEVKIALQGDTARIDHFTARAGNGSVTLKGNAQLGEAPLARLQLEADKFQLLGRVDRRIVTSGSGQLTLDRNSTRIDGRFAVDEGLFDFTRSDAPSLGDDVVVTGRSSAQVEAQAAATPTPETSRNTSIDVQVDLGKRLRLKGRGIDTGLEGEMRITTPGGLPSWNGSVRTAGGTYAAYGQKLDIARGVISFYGPVADPRLDILAIRPNLDVQVGVTITGTAQNPRVRLYSSPDMSDIDKLSWLMLGRASDGLGSSDTALLQRAALALLAGDSPGVADQVMKSIGLDDVSVRQSEGEVKETVVALGKQLSRRWYVGYERGLNTTTGNWQLIYRIAQRFTVRAQSGSDNSLDLIWTWRWD